MQGSGGEIKNVEYEEKLQIEKEKVIGAHEKTLKINSLIKAVICTIITSGFCVSINDMRIFTERNRNKKLLVGKNRDENIIILLEVIYFYLIARCFFQHTEYAVYLELALILGMFVTTICLWNAEQNVKLQLFWLNFIFFLLWTAGILCKESYKGNRILIISGWLCFFAGMLIPGIFLIRTTEWKNVSNYKAVALICIIFAVLSIEVIDEVPMYDSGAYYSWSISKLASHFDFTCRNIFDYCLASHISVGYGMFTLLGELISSGGYGTHFINILLAICSIVAFFKSFELLFPNQNRTGIILATGIYAFAPNMLGMIGTINIDVPGIYFFVILWYCYLKKYRALELFFAWIFVCTKEPNVIYYAFYIIGIVLEEVWSKNTGVPIVKRFVKTVFLQIVRVIPIIFWRIYYIAPGRDSWVADTQLLVNSSGLHTFGFSVDNMVVKLKEILIFNGSWIFTIFILLSAFYILFKKIAVCLKPIIPLLFTMIGVIIFNIFYLDYPHPRYLSFGIMIFCMISVFLLLSTQRQLLINIALGIGNLILLIQSFVTIDPFTYMNFPVINYSDSPSKIVSADGYKLDDGAIYNREYSYWGKTMNLVLEKAGYDADTIIVFSAYENIPKAYGYSDKMHWNIKKKQIQVNSSEETIPVLIANNADELTAYKKIIYVVPFYTHKENILPFEYSELQDTFEVEYRTLGAKCYVCSGFGDKQTESNYGE